jgi:hypothetical protein
LYIVFVSWVSASEIGTMLEHQFNATSISFAIQDGNNWIEFTSIFLYLYVLFIYIFVLFVHIIYMYTLLIYIYTFIFFNFFVGAQAGQTVTIPYHRYLLINNSLFFLYFCFYIYVLILCVVLIFRFLMYISTSCQGISTHSISNGKYFWLCHLCAITLYWFFWFFLFLVCFL